ncbi:hypothetical protein [Nostoc sp.]|uniref:hypothetical protein n=1 Tax=Nostoc sp. TaxID=1180 RepID=UPI002FFB2CF1
MRRQQFKRQLPTPDGINAAVAAALMSHYFIYRLGAKRKLGEFLEGYVSGEWNQLIPMRRNIPITKLNQKPVVQLG